MITVVAVPLLATAWPLVVAAAVALSGFRLGFAILALPGLAALVALAWLGHEVPAPADYERAAASDRPRDGGGTLPARGGRRPRPRRPPRRRLRTFTAIYGLAWLAGSTAIGVLYTHSTRSATTFVVVLQAAALVAFIPVARGSTRP